MLPEGLHLATFTQDFRSLDVNSTGQVIKAGNVQVFLLVFANTTSGTLYVKLYDKATAPTSSDTPKHTYPVPGGWIQQLDFADPDYYVKGFGIRATTGVADSDTNSPSSNGLVANVHYK